MQDEESLKSHALSIIVWCTILFTILVLQAFALGWNKTELVFISIGIVGCWVIHFTTSISFLNKLWIYFSLAMLMFFSYGIHATSLWDIALVNVFVMLLFYSLRIKKMISVCSAVYFFTALYNLLFAKDSVFDFSYLAISRTVFHFLLVYVAGRSVKRFFDLDKRNDLIISNKLQYLEETTDRTIDFLANVSHELRTPINVITGTTAMSLKTERDPEKRQSILYMQEAGNKLFGMVEKILDYAEISSHRIMLFEDNYIFLSLANDIISESRVLHSNENVELIFDVDTEVPSVLIGDSRKIKKVACLLIDNAVKFTKSGAVYVKIYAIKKSYGVNLRIEVRDTGKGISKAEMPKITLGFYQGNSGRNRSTGGLGLGLPIAYGLVSAMKGFIHIESEVHEGSLFTVSIPQRVVDSSPSITFSDQEAISVALFLSIDKYAMPEVNFFYNETLDHMVRGLEVPVYRVFDLPKLKKLVDGYDLTHLFMGEDEYNEDRQYFEDLSSKLSIVVVASPSFSLPKGSQIKVVQKPLWVLPILNILNSNLKDKTASSTKKRMLCPGVRILVVDDEPMNLMIIEAFLKEYKMKVTLADSGKKALELYENENFDIIFLDHMMPEMDGIETMHRLRLLSSKTGAVLRVVAFTANVISSAREMFIAEGFAEFLSKPVEIMELERVLRKVLPDTMITCVDSDDEQFLGIENLLPAELQGIEEMAETKEEKKEDNPLALLKSAGINTDLGLGYCRNDMDFYRELLLKFAEDAAEKQKKIGAFYEERDFDNYRILVHALKSTAKMIGADSLSESAKAMEDAAKNKDGAYIEENHESLMRQYIAVTDTLNTALGVSESESAASTLPEGNAPSISKEDFIFNLGELKRCFATFEADKAIEIIDSMGGKNYEGQSISALLNPIKQAIDDFDFSAAEEKLESLITSLKGESQ